MNKKLKALISICLTLILLSAFTVQAYAANGARYDLNMDVNAQSYILVSLDTGEIIFEKNSHEQRTPASLTKLMTSLMVFLYIDDIDNTMITAPNYIYDELYGKNGSTADIRQGETLSARDLLYAMLLPSANEAANIIADYIGKGSMKNFYMMMNNEAKKLGCQNTYFSNAHGLFSENHYTTAYDMYLIAKAAYETEGFMEIATATSYQMPANLKHSDPYYISTTVRMQSRTSPYYRSYIKGLKTGSLPEAGHNFVTVCEKNGERYILVVMGAEYSSATSSSEGERPAFATTIEIMDYFFENYTLKSANDLTYPVTELPLKYSKDQDTILLYPDSQVMSVLLNDVDESSFQKVFNLPEFIGAPINAGDAVGSVDYYLAGQLVGTSQLVAQDTVERSTIVFLFDKFMQMINSLYFKVVILVTIALIIIYAIYAYFNMKKQEKMNKVMRRTKK